MAAQGDEVAVVEGACQGGLRRQARVHRHGGARPEVNVVQVGVVLEGALGKIKPVTILLSTTQYGMMPHILDCQTKAYFASHLLLMFNSKNCTIA